MALIKGCVSGGALMLAGSAGGAKDPLSGLGGFDAAEHYLL